MTWWKDIDIELNRKLDGDIKEYLDENAITQSIRNIILTMLGQRRRRPTFAYGVHFLLFEQVEPSTAQQMADLIWNNILAWDNRVILEEVIVKSDPDNHKYDLSITFRIQGKHTPDPYTYKEIIYAA